MLQTFSIIVSGKVQGSPIPAFLKGKESHAQNQLIQITG